MSRLSNNEFKDKKLINGFDYDNQCWVIEGLVQRCGHPETMDCQCYGKIHAGEKSESSES